MAAHQAPHPWDSPGKNTGVGCHFLLQCMKVKSESEVTQLCLTLSDPMDCSPPGSSIHGIFQTRVLEWGAIAFSAPTSTCLKLSTIKSEKRKHSTVKTDTTLHSWFTVKQQMHISFSSQFLPETRGLRECCPILDILKGEPTPLGPASTAHKGTEKLLWNERF